MEKLNRQTNLEWRNRGDDVEGLPFIVVFKDKATFPASDYYPTLDAARAASASRPADCIMERKWDAKGREVARMVA